MKMGFLLRSTTSKVNAFKEYDMMTTSPLCSSLEMTSSHSTSPVPPQETSQTTDKTRNVRSTTIDRTLKQQKAMNNFHDDGNIVIDLSSPESWKKTSYHHIIPQRAAGLYSLIFFRCQPHADTVTVNFHLEVIFHNPGPDYLSAGDAPLPLIYLLLFLLYSLVTLIWFWILFSASSSVSSSSSPLSSSSPSSLSHTSKPSSSSSSLNHLHRLMAALLIIKTITLLTQSFHFYSLSQHGTNDPSASSSSSLSLSLFIYYLFASLKGLMLFLVLLFIGSGYLSIKPYLTSREKTLILIVLILQIINNIAMIVLEETSPGSIGWFNWSDLLHVVDLLCCVAILYPIFWSIHHLRQTADIEGTRSHAQKNLLKLQLFRQFYVLVLCYLYFTRVIVYLLTVSVSRL
jgi:G protein-coupled receptor 107